jgi:outer membrane protein
MNDAIQNSREGTKLQERFKAEYDKTKAAMDKKGQDLERRANDFNGIQGTLSEAEREKRRAALTQEIEAFQAETEKASRDFMASMEKAMGPLYDRAEKAVGELAKARGYLAVVENGTENAIIYASPGISVVDVTPEITAALDGRKPK